MRNWRAAYRWGMRSSTPVKTRDQRQKRALDQDRRPPSGAAPERGLPQGDRQALITGTPGAGHNGLQRWGYRLVPLVFITIGSLILIQAYA
ncbi:hypothetical protein V6U89_26845 [Micromonospora sp. CPCC 206171]|uniref:hypothetical protein n=1 Tax=Micromonospora sp. CPCC 206171 TaxID=3122405 RepID=UPI002FF3B2B8